MPIQEDNRLTPVVGVGWFRKYTKLSLLTVGIVVLIYLLIWMIMSIVGVAFLPLFLHVGISVLGAGLLVAKFFAFRLA